MTIINGRVRDSGNREIATALVGGLHIPGSFFMRINVNED